MTHFLVASEMYQTLQQINRLSALRGSDKMIQMEQFLNTAKARIEKQYLQYCDINIPIQKCALLLGRLLIGKTEVFVRQQSLRGLNAEESAARATQETLELACDTIELGIEMKTDELLGNFQWLFSTFAEHHLLTYTLWHLCVRPRRARRRQGVGRREQAVYAHRDAGLASSRPKWNVLRKLREKASGIRQALRLQSSTRTMTAAVDLVLPPQQAPTAADLQQADQAIFDAADTAPMFAEGMVWDGDSLWFPDWVGYPAVF